MTTGILRKSTSFSCVCFLGFLCIGCGGSDDPVTQPAPTVPPTSPPDVEAGIYGATVVEGADNLEFVVSLFSAHTETITVDYATADGTAIAGTDYSGTNGTVQFLPGEMRKFITVNVLDNTAAQTETSKNMKLVLSNPENVCLLYTSDAADDYFWV